MTITRYINLNSGALFDVEDMGSFNNEIVTIDIIVQPLNDAAQQLLQNHLSQMKVFTIDEEQYYGLNATYDLSLFSVTPISNDPLYIQYKQIVIDNLTQILDIVKYTETDPDSQIVSDQPVIPALSTPDLSTVYHVSSTNNIKFSIVPYLSYDEVNDKYYYLFKGECFLTDTDKKINSTDPPLIVGDNDFIDYSMSFDFEDRFNLAVATNREGTCDISTFNSTIQRTKDFIDTIIFLDIYVPPPDVDLPPDIIGFYKTQEVTYYYWCHYSATSSNGDIIVNYTLTWGIDEPTKTFSSKQYKYDPNDEETSKTQLTLLGTHEIEELCAQLDSSSGVKLVTVNTSGSQETGATPFDLSKKALVVVGHGLEQGIDPTLKGLLHFEGSDIKDETDGTWTLKGDNFKITSNNAFADNAIVISDGFYFFSDEIEIGIDSFTIDFFAFTNSNSPAGSCLCNIAHPITDIKISLLKENDITYVGLYLNDVLTVQTKKDIQIADALAHYAVVYQKSKETLFFFVNGFLIGSKQGTILKEPTRIYFNRDIIANRSTFLGTIDEIRISTGVSRWIPSGELKDYGTEKIKKTKIVTEKRTVQNIMTPGWSIKGITRRGGIDSGSTELIVEEFCTISYIGEPFTINTNKFCIVADFSTKDTIDEPMTGNVYDIKFTDGNALKLTITHNNILINDKPVAIKSIVNPANLDYIDIDYDLKNDSISIDTNRSGYDLNASEYLNYNGTKTVASISLYAGSVFEMIHGFYIGNDVLCLSGNFDRNYSIGSLSTQRELAMSHDPNVKAFFASYIYDKDFSKIETVEIEVPTGVVIEEEVEVANPNYVFKPPTEPYNAKLYSTGTVQGMTDFYIPLTEYFDDNKFIAVKHVPSQKDIPNYDGVTEFEPVWDNYDPMQLKLEGDIKSKEAGPHYVTFTPWNDHVWSNGKTDPKTAVWFVEKNIIDKYPVQTTVLTYNGQQQEINLTNFNSDIMELSGTATAIDANTIDEPYYIAYVTPKNHAIWPSGDSNPYEVKWKIQQKMVSKPILRSDSSLDYVYDGTKKSPIFDYDTVNIVISGTTEATNPNARNSDKAILTQEYVMVFSLKDKRNYCWQEEQIGNNLDISQRWYIRRKPVQNFRITGTEFIYNGKEQGPTMSPSSWDESEVTVTGNKGKEIGNYQLELKLTDIMKYEWSDGTVDKKVINWAISKARGTLRLSTKYVELISTTQVKDPVEMITITTTNKGNILISENPYIQTTLTDKTLTVKGLQATINGPVTFTITCEEDNDYLAVSDTVTVKVIRGLEAYSWKEIADMVSKGTLLNASYIGDTKTIKLYRKKKDNDVEAADDPDNKDIYTTAIKAILIGVDHNETVEGNKKAHFMLGWSDRHFHVSLQNTQYPFALNDNKGGWNFSYIKSQFTRSNSGFCYTDILEQELLDVLTPCIKWTDNQGGGRNESFYVTPTLEYFTLLSEYELTGKIVYSNFAEGMKQEQYEYFMRPGNSAFSSFNLQTNFVNTGGSPLCFLRSVNATNSNKIIATWISGSSVYDINDCCDIVPIFTVSKKTVDEIKIPAVETCVETMLHFDDSSDPFKDECNSSFTVYNKDDKVISANVSSSLSKFGSALQFDGSCYAVQDFPITFGGKDCTIDFWAYYDGRSLDESSKHRVGLFVLRSDKMDIRFRRLGTSSAQGSNVINAEIRWLTDDAPEHPTVPGKEVWIQKTDTTLINKWAHYAIVYDHSEETFFIYFNGALTTRVADDAVGVIKLPFRTSQYRLTFGRIPTNENYMVGALDELRIVNGLARWLPPAWAYTRQATTTDKDRFVFTPPDHPSTVSDDDIIHDQKTQGYIIKIGNLNRIKRFPITQHFGELHVISAQPSIATAVIENDTVIITGISAGTTNVTIYTDDTDTTVGNVKILTVMCDESVPYPTLEECEPIQIRNIIRSGHAQDAWQLGSKTKSIKIQGTINGKSYDTTMRAILIGIDHNIAQESNNTHCAHFIFENKFESLPMNSSANSTSGGWKESNMRKTFCEQLLQALPVEWRNVIVPVTKYSNNSGSGKNNTSDITSTEDKLWLLSIYEINGDTVSCNPYEHVSQNTYSYIQNNAENILLDDIYTRSASKTSGNDFIIFSKDATVNQNKVGAQFCFGIADFAEPERLSETASNFVAVREVPFDGAIHNAIEEGIITTQDRVKLSSDYYTWSGNFISIYANSYTVEIKPAYGYVWNNGTSSVKNVVWKISPIKETLTLNKEEIRLYYKNNFSDKIELIRNNNSDIIVQFGDPSLVSYKVINNTVTFTAEGTGETTATIISPAAGNYDACSVTINVKASKISALDTLSPLDIVRVVSQGHAVLAWDIGDITQKITIKGNLINKTINGIVSESVNVQCYAYILGFDHNKDKEGTNTLHLCLGRTLATKDTGLLSLTVNNSTWEESILKANCDIIYTLLSDDWRKMISPCTKGTFKDPIWLMSTAEVLGTSSTTDKQYHYYSNGNSPIRESEDWFTRDINNNVPVLISDKGTIKNGNTGLFVPCFIINRLKALPNIRVSKTDFNIPVGLTDTFSVNRNGTGTVTVRSTDPTVATVTEGNDGYTISAIKTGNVQIIVKVEETDIYCVDIKVLTVTVGVLQKTSAILNLSANSLNIIKGGTATFTATVEGGTLSVQSSNTTVATVSLNNNQVTVKGINEGTTSVVVKATGDAYHNDTERTVNIVVSEEAVSLKIIPAEYSTITFKDNLVYNETTQQVVNSLRGYSELYHVLSGDLSKKDHNDIGDYTVTVTPKVGYQWYEGGTESRSISWNIKKANNSIVGQSDITLIRNSANSVTINYEVKENAMISVKNNSNPSLVTVDINNSAVTFSSLCNYNSSEFVTLQAFETLNYNSAELDIMIDIRMTALTIIPDIANKTTLTLNRESATFDENTYYGINNENAQLWISNFNPVYHMISSIVDINNNSVRVHDAGTYVILVVPSQDYVWDNTGDKTPVQITWTINRRKLAVNTATQTGLSGTGTTMTYDGSAQTPVFDIQDKIIVRVSGQIDAGIYKTTDTLAYVKPNSNYLWADSLSEERPVAWYINRAIIFDDEMPVENTPLIFNGFAQRPEAQNFTFDSTKCTFTEPEVAQIQVGIYDTETTGARFTPTKNYCWSDHSTVTIIVSWSIVMRNLKKPTAAAFSQPYDGTLKGPVIYNNVTASNGFIKVTGRNYLAEVWSEENKTGFSLTPNTTVYFSAIDVGNYSIIYSLNNTDGADDVTWEDGTKDDVVISYSITRVEIPADQVPMTGEPKAAIWYMDGDSVLFQQQAPTFVNDYSDITPQKYTKHFSLESTPGDYIAQFLPTKNYCWMTSIQENILGYRNVQWSIKKTEGFIEIEYPQGKPKPSELTNSVYSTDIKLISASGAVSWSIDKNYIARLDFDQTTNLLIVTAVGEGSATISIKAAESDLFSEKTLDIPVRLTIVHEPMTKDKPWNLVKNFLQHLLWYNTEGYYYHMLGSYDATNRSIIVDPDTIVYPKDIKATTISALDFAVYKVTNGSLTCVQDVVDIMKGFADQVSSTSQAIASLKTNYNIDLNNVDRGAIFGFDIGVSPTQINSSDIIPEEGTLKPYPDETSVISGITVTWPTTATTTSGTRSLTSNEKYAVQAMNTWWIPIPLNLIDTYYGINVYNPFYTIPEKTMSVAFEPLDSTTLAQGGVDSIELVNLDAEVVNDSIFANIYGITDAKTKQKYQYHLTGDYVHFANMCLKFGVDVIATMNQDEDGTLGPERDTHSATDIVVAHELVHALLFSGMRFHGAYPTWFIESIAELIWGIDIRTNALLSLASNSTILQQVFEENVPIPTGATSDEKLLIDNYPYVFAYMMFRYLIKTYCK